MPGVAPASLPVAAATNPTTSDNASRGYSAGSRWINTASGQSWVYVSEAAGVAVWELMDVSDFPGFLSGGRYCSVDNINGSNTLVAGTGYFAPFMVKGLITPTKLGVRTNTAAAGAATKLAIFASNAATLLPAGTPIIAYDGAGTGLPTAAANINCDATLSASALLVPGRLYWTFAIGNTSPVLVAGNGASTLVGRLTGLGVTTNAFQYTGYTCTGLTFSNDVGALNATGLSLTAIGGTSGPAVYLMP